MALFVAVAAGDCALDEPGDNVGDGDPGLKSFISLNNPSRVIAAGSGICFAVLSSSLPSSLAALAFASAALMRRCVLDCGGRSASESDMAPSGNKEVRGEVEGVSGDVVLVEDIILRRVYFFIDKGN